MTTQPDPAAVRCAEKVWNAGPRIAEIIERECALPEGRALAEAVLKFQGKRPELAGRVRLLGLARAYLAALDGITQPDASHRVGDSPSSDDQAEDGKLPQW